MNEEELIRFVSDGFDAAKNGKAVETYNAVLPCFEKGILPLKSHYAFGWIIYYALHQEASSAISERKLMLASYLRLRVAKPHKLHSMILTEAIRLYKDAKDESFVKKSGSPAFSIVKFVDLWNLAHLRPGDWNRKSLDGKPLGSTVEKLITVYTDEIEQKGSIPSEDFIAVIDKATEQFKDSSALLSQRASLHIRAGETGIARDLLRNALISAPGKFFLWSRLASLISPEENVRLHIALLYKALRMPGQEQFKGRIRLALARVWLSRNMPGQARWELDRVRNIYESNGWHLPKAFAEADSRIPPQTSAENPERFYSRLEYLADEEVYSALPEIRVTKTYHKNPDPSAAAKGFGKPAAAWRVTDEQGTNYWLQPHRFNIDAALRCGTPLLVRIHNGKPVKARLESEADV